MIPESVCSTTVDDLLSECGDVSACFRKCLVSKADNLLSVCAPKAKERSDSIREHELNRVCNPMSFIKDETSHSKMLRCFLDP